MQTVVAPVFTKLSMPVDLLTRAFRWIAWNTKTRPRKSLGFRSLVEPFANNLWEPGFGYTQ